MRCYAKSYDTYFVQTVRRRINEKAILLEVFSLVAATDCFQKIKTTEVQIYTQLFGKQFSFNSKRYVSKSALIYVFYWNEDPQCEDTALGCIDNRIQNPPNKINNAKFTC